MISVLTVSKRKCFPLSNINKFLPKRKMIAFVCNIQSKNLSQMFAHMIVSVEN